MDITYLERMMQQAHGFVAIVPDRSCHGDVNYGCRDRPDRAGPKGLIFDLRSKLPDRPGVQHWIPPCRDRSASTYRVPPGLSLTRCCPHNPPRSGLRKQAKTFGTPECGCVASTEGVPSLVEGW
jgi:hypothetical protein